MRLGQILFYFCYRFLTFLLGLLAVVAVVLTHPLSFYKRRKRIVPPSCLIDPSLGDHHFVTANGIKFHYVSKGDNSKPLMLLLHGFPEFWFSWRNQLKFFSNDYHVVAIDLKGYGETDKPADKGQYAMDVLVEDIVQLVKVLSPDRKCILVGHDWGGAIAWTVAQKHSELLNKLIIMNCPHPKIMGRAFRKGWKQILRSWYIFFFQTPWLPETLISLVDYKAFADLRKSIINSPNNETFSEDEIIEAYKYTFGQPGALTPPINYYRNILSRARRYEFTELIHIPTLLLWGESDVAFDSALPHQHNEICTNISLKLIPNCSHWVQQDNPDLTNQYMKEFLAQ